MTSYTVHNKVVSNYADNSTVMDFNFNESKSKMNSGNKKNVYQKFLELGFKKIDSQDKWIFDNNLPDHTQTDIYKIAHWEVEEIEELQFSQNIQITLCKNKLRKKLKYFADIYIGAKSKKEFFFLDNGDCWCFFDFELSERSAEDLYGIDLPVGTAGFKFQVIGFNDTIRIMLSEHFYIGFVPNTFISATVKIIDSTFGIENNRHETNSTLFERFIKIIDIPLLTLQPLDRNEILQSNIEYLATIPLKTNYSAFVTTQSKQWILYTDLKFSRQPQNLNSKAPLEVLESREYSPKYSTLDKLISDGYFSEAIQVINQAINNNELSDYIIRRIATLYLSGQVHILQDFIYIEDQNKLITSFHLKKEISIRKFDSALETLSKLGAMLIDSGIKINQLQFFDHVFSELLGDLWISEKVETAISCYHRILKKKGNNSRVLHKLASIMRIKKDHSEEKAYLDQLLQVEINHTKLSNAYLRRAEIAFNYDHNFYEAMTYSYKSLQFNKLQHQSILLLIESLIKLRNTEKAIEILSEIINDSANKFDNTILAQFNCKLAQIWGQHHNRNDLAKIRYERALTLDNSCSEAFEALEEFYLSHNVKTEFIPVLEHRIKNINFKINNETNFWHFKDLITQLIKIHDQEKIGILFHYLCENKKVTVEYISQFYELAPKHINWKLFANMVQEFCTSSSSKDTTAELYNLLATIHRTHLSETDYAIDCCQKAMEYGWLDQENIIFLKEILLNTNRIAEYINVLLWLINLNNNPHSEENFELILIHKKLLKDEELDSILIKYYHIEQKKKYLIENRILHYAKLNQLPQLKSFMEQFFVSLKQTSDFEHFINFLNHMLIKYFGKSASQEIDSNFRNLIAMDYQLNYLDQAIEFFNNTNEIDYLSTYIKKSIDESIIPKIDHKNILVALQGSSEYTSRYLNFKIMNTTCIEDKILLLEEYLSLNHDKQDNKDYLDKLLYYANNTQLNSQKLQTFFNLCQKFNRFDDYNRAIDFQLSAYEFDEALCQELYLKLSHISFDHYSDIKLGISYLKELVNKFPYKVDTFKLLCEECISHHLDLECLDQAKSFLEFSLKSNNFQSFEEVFQLLQRSFVLIERITLFLKELLKTETAENYRIFKDFISSNSIINNQSFVSLDLEFSKVAGDSSLVSSTEHLNVMDEDKVWDSIFENPIFSGISIDLILNNNQLTDIKKHIAIQIIALKTGEIYRIKDWKWQTWRTFINLKKQRPWKLIPPINLVLKSNISKLILATAPIFVKIYKSKFLIKNQIDINQLRVEKFNHVKEEHSFMVESKLQEYYYLLEKNKLQILNCSSFENEVFFDGSKKAFYINIEKWNETNYHILRQKLIHTIFLLEQQFFVFKALNLETEIWPVIEALNYYLHSNTEYSSSFTNIFKNSDLSLIKKISTQVPFPNKLQLESLLQQVDFFMNELILSETFDLIGRVESICDFNAFELSPPEINHKLENQIEVEKLIQFAIQYFFS